MFKNDIKIDRKMNRKIRNDWAAEFPNFRKDKHTVLNRRVGPLLISLWHRIKHQTDIAPCISYVNLSNPHISGSLGCTLKFEDLINGYNSKIKYYRWQEHEAGVYKDIANEFREYATIPLEGPVKLSQIIEAHKKEQYPTCIEVYEDPALIAAYCDKPDVAKQHIQYVMQHLREKGYERLWQHESLEAWEADMLKRIQDPEKLRRITEEQVIFHKLEKIPHEDIVVDL